MIGLIKVLVFSDTMESILLLKGEVFSPPGGQINRAESINASSSRIMAPLIGIDPTKQPFWYHIRTEIFQDVMVHVLYGKLSLDELLKIERFNREFVLLETKGICGRSDVAHRLRYLTPMACTLDCLERHMWPRP